MIGHLALSYDNEMGTIVRQLLNHRPTFGTPFG